MENNKKSFIFGMLGGLCLVLLIIIVSLGCNLHHSIFRPIRIVSKEINIDSIKQTEIKEKRYEIEKLEKKGLLLTPQEYTNNIVNYYNTVITLLITLLAAFSLIAFMHLKFITQDEVKKNVAELLRKSPEIQNILLENFSGKIEESLDDIPDKINKLTEEVNELIEEVNKLKTISKGIDDGNSDDDGNGGGDDGDEAYLSKLKVKR